MEARELIHGGYPQAHPYAAEKRHAAADTKTTAAADHFMVEDLLDFSNDDGTFDVITGGGGGCSAESSTVTAVDSCNSSFSGPEPHFAGDFEFSGDLCVQHEDLAELEWLSNFVEESFSSEDFQKLQLISSVKTRPADEGSESLEFQPEQVPEQTPIFRPELPVPGKARSKRSRAAPCNWTSRLLVLSPTSSAAAVNGAPSAASAFVPPTAAAIPPTGGKKPIKAMQRKEARPDKDPGGGGDGRKCLHCATDKTPQWRTGPMGPKTLCNACGVRYKSGRLVPEYRPAASPTFVLTKHSNSHRKVLELRRQKEAVRSTHPHPQQFLHQGMIFDVSNGDDYLIHQHVGPDFRQLI